MTPPDHYLACDLGAESGRLVLGTLEAGRLDLKEIHRFPTGATSSNGSLVWDMPRIIAAWHDGLRRAAGLNLPLRGYSADSWGLDYLLFDRTGALIEPAYHYRDPRSALGRERVFARVKPEAIFAETGIQFLPFNTLFQLAAETPERLERADRLLLIGDAFNYLLCGAARAEISLASTTQLFNPTTRTWSPLLLEALGFPARLLPPLANSGTVLGPARATPLGATGLEGMPVIATCSHDTGAAVAAVPGLDESAAYISSGTWSLMGVERSSPILTDLAREWNFTNELGHGGSVRLLKNISGLWLVQECRRQWVSEGRDTDYEALTRLAAEAPPFVSLIHPSDPRFIAPDNMPETIAAYCRETGQTAPASPGATIRCALDSLALLYRETLGALERVTGSRLRRIHIVGGGSRNALLNQMTADACGVPVCAGPAEATSAGNILIQALALNRLPSLDAARRVLQDSFPVTVHHPRDGAELPKAVARFQQLPGSARPG